MFGKSGQNCNTNKSRCFTDDENKQLERLISDVKSVLRGSSSRDTSKLNAIQREIDRLPRLMVSKISEKHESFYGLLKPSLGERLTLKLSTTITNCAKEHIGKDTITVRTLKGRMVWPKVPLLTAKELAKLLQALPDEFAVAIASKKCFELTLVAMVRLCAASTSPYFSQSERDLFDLCLWVPRKDPPWSWLRLLDLFHCLEQALSKPQRKLIFGPHPSFDNRMLYFRRYILMHPRQLRLYPDYVHRVNTSYRASDKSLSDSETNYCSSERGEQLSTYESDQGVEIQKRRKLVPCVQVKSRAKGAAVRKQIARNLPSARKTTTEDNNEETRDKHLVGATANGRKVCGETKEDHLDKFENGIPSSSDQNLFDILQNELLENVKCWRNSPENINQKDSNKQVENGRKKLTEILTSENLPQTVKNLQNTGEATRNGEDRHRRKNNLEDYDQSSHSPPKKHKIESGASCKSVDPKKSKRWKQESTEYVGDQKEDKLSFTGVISLLTPLVSKSESLCTKVCNIARTLLSERGNSRQRLSALVEQVTRAIYSPDEIATLDGLKSVKAEMQAEIAEILRENCAFQCFQFGPEKREFVRLGAKVQKNAENEVPQSSRSVAPPPPPTGLFVRADARCLESLTGVSCDALASYVRSLLWTEAEALHLDSISAKARERFGSEPASSAFRGVILYSQLVFSVQRDRRLRLDAFRRLVSARADDSVSTTDPDLDRIFRPCVVQRVRGSMMTFVEENAQSVTLTQLLEHVTRECRADHHVDDHKVRVAETPLELLVRCLIAADGDDVEFSPRGRVQTRGRSVNGHGAEGTTDEPKADKEEPAVSGAACKLYDHNDNEERDVENSISRWSPDVEPLPLPKSERLAPDLPYPQTTGVVRKSVDARFQLSAKSEPWSVDDSTFVRELFGSPSPVSLAPSDQMVDVPPHMTEMNLLSVRINERNRLAISVEIPLSYGSGNMHQNSRHPPSASIPRQPEASASPAPGSTDKSRHDQASVERKARLSKERRLEQFALTYLAARSFRARTDDLIEAGWKAMQEKQLTSSALAFEAYFRDCIGSLGDNLCFGDRDGAPGVTWTYSRPPPGVALPGAPRNNFGNLLGADDVLARVASTCRRHLSKCGNTKSKLCDLTCVVHGELGRHVQEMLGPSADKQAIPVCRNLVLAACIRNVDVFRFSKVDSTIRLYNPVAQLPKSKCREVKTRALPPTEKTPLAISTPAPPAPNDVPTFSPQENNNKTPETRPIASPIRFPASPSRVTEPPDKHRRIPVLIGNRSSDGALQVDVLQRSRVEEPSRLPEKPDEHAELCRRRFTAANPPSAPDDDATTRHVRAVRSIASLLREHGPLSMRQLRDHWSLTGEPHLVKLFGTGVSFAMALQKLAAVFPADRNDMLTVDEEALALTFAQMQNL